jgi:hypothetical protein
VPGDKDFEPFPIRKGFQDVFRNKGGTALRASDAVEGPRAQLGGAFNVRGLHFLFSPGCSSIRVHVVEVRFPNTGVMAKSFLNTVGANDQAHLAFGPAGVPRVAARIDLLL